MAKTLVRKLLNVFGLAGSDTYFGEFGSKAAGSPTHTKDIETIQDLSAWDNGLQDALNVSNRLPFLEDMNSLFHVHSYQTAYMLQEGIPEYDASSTYYIGSIVKKTGTFELYGSLVDSNTGNALPSKTTTTYWQYLGLLGSNNWEKVYDAILSSSVNRVDIGPLSGNIQYKLIVEFVSTGAFTLSLQFNSDSEFLYGVSGFTNGTFSSAGNLYHIPISGATTGSQVGFLEALIGFNTYRCIPVIANGLQNTNAANAPSLRTVAGIYYPTAPYATINTISLICVDGAGQMTNGTRITLWGRKS